MIKINEPKYNKNVEIKAEEKGNHIYAIYLTDTQIKDFNTILRRAKSQRDYEFRKKKRAIEEGSGYKRNPYRRKDNYTIII